MADLLQTLTDVHARVAQLGPNDQNTYDVHALLTQAASLTHALSQLVNDRAPISRLPNEILTTIVTYAAIHDASSQIQRRTVRALACVSQHWRDICLSTPALWAFFRIDRRRLDPERLEAHLARSVNAPLRIELILKLPKTSNITINTKPPSHAHPDAVYPLLAPHSARIQTLHLETVHPTALFEWRATCLAHACSFPALHSLTVNPEYAPAIFEPFWVSDSDLPPNPTQSPLALPALRTLRLYSYVTWPPALFTNLTALELHIHAPMFRPGLSFLLDVFALSPGLERILLADHGPTVDDSGPIVEGYPRRRVSLPRLETLDLYDCHTRLILEHVEVPESAVVRSVDLEGRVERALLIGRSDNVNLPSDILGDLPEDASALGPLVAAQYATITCGRGMVGVDIGSPQQQPSHDSSRDTLNTLSSGGGGGHISMGETRLADRWPFSPIMMLAFTVNNVAAHPHLQNLKSVVVGLERGVDTILLRRANTAPAVALPSGPASFAVDSSDPLAPTSSAETTSAEGSADPPTVELSNPPTVDLSALVAYHPVATMLETSLHTLLAMPRLRSLGTSGLPVDFALDAVGRRGSRLRHLTLKVDLLEEGEFASATEEKGHHEAEPQSSGKEKQGTAPEVVAATSASSFVEPLPRAIDPLPHAWRWLARVRDSAAPGRQR
ncbi:hypothetical protein GGF50DRAFT_119493 [Schizophyllum commune]